MPLWNRWGLLVVEIVVAVLVFFVVELVVASVVFELQLLEDLLQLMRRSWRTTYGMRVIVIVHGNVRACASLLRASILWRYCRR